MNTEKIQKMNRKLSLVLGAAGIILSVALILLTDLTPLGAYIFQNENLYLFFIIEFIFGLLVGSYFTANADNRTVRYVGALVIGVLTTILTFFLTFILAFVLR